jgi:hypothetical protein
MPYIGKTPLTGAYQLCDTITTSATATYNLTVGGSAVIPGAAQNCIVSLNGVVQAPVSAYTVSGSTIVFSSTLSATDVIDFILILGNVFDIGKPTDGSVTNASVSASAAIALSKLATTGTMTFASTIGVGGATPAASGAGITFPATASLSSDGNTLDDYEEGTWTPTYVAGGTNFSSVTYEQQTGRYTKIGRIIILTVAISTNAITKGSAAGDVYIAGLPFQSNGFFSVGTILYNSANWAGDIPDGWTLFNGTSVGYLYYKSSTTAVTNINPDDLGTGGSANNFGATMIYTTGS